MVKRRHFMAGGLGLIVFPGLSLAAANELRLMSPLSRDGKHFFGRLDEQEASPRLVAMPMRGHGVAPDPLRPAEVLVVARRPGTLIAKVDLRSGALLSQWEAAEDRHFYGHAAYSRDGRHVYLTESDVDTGKGVVSVRDSGDMRVLAEYKTGGIGPHELLLMPDGVTLAVANGGVQTFPETGRVKLNRGRIETSLVYLDSRDGKLLDKQVVPSVNQSLRHLAVTPDGTVAAALQFEGSRTENEVPLMMIHRPGTALRFASAPDEAWTAMKRYAASVEYDPRSGRFALSCPLGDLLACFDGEGRHLGNIDIPKVSGITFGQDYGFASNELGQLYRLDMKALKATLHSSHAGVQWDNHLYIDLA